MNAALTATVDNSSFAMLSITQTGGGPDHRVELGNDNIPASVSVSEGNANGDSITLDNGDTFGPTTLLQGNGGPSDPNSLGNNDTVSVASGSYKNLTVEQLLNGTKNTITLSSARHLPDQTPHGPVRRCDDLAGQRRWRRYHDHWGHDPTPPPQSNRYLRTLAVSNITVSQGSGSGDSASVGTSSVPGNISITQTDVASNTRGRYGHDLRRHGRG